MYQLEIERCYLECCEALCLYRYPIGDEKYELIKVVNTTCRFKKQIMRITETFSINSN